jgi:minor extracellular serine protease Vpr
MKVSWRGWLAGAAIAAGVAGGLRADDDQVATAPPDAGAPVTTEQQVPGRWFVELDSSVDAFRAAAAASGILYKEHFVYKKIWKGVSVEASGDGAALLGKVRGVKAVFPVLVVPRPTTEEISPELAYALAMTGADAAQSTGLSGAGVKVAVMDTGIDYHHPDLGGGFGPGYRVVAGYDFVGDRYNAGGSGGALIPHPDNDPDDCNGHGTHVAGIIGASGDPTSSDDLRTRPARGVAPGVTFGAYRVFGCDGSTSADIMLAAMERAHGDGMDVLNMSIGSAFQTWPQYPTAVGADNLVDRGMVVVASIGNSGASGVYSAGAPGVGRKVIGVASFDNSHVERPIFTVSPDGKEVGYSQAAGAPAAPTSGTSPMARTGTSSSTADACSALPAGSLTGKVALIRRGTCTFYVKSKNAEAAGAVSVVIYNNVAGLQSITVAPPTSADPPVVIPVVSISAADGGVIDGRIAAGPVELTWTDEMRTFVNPTGGLASSFTSFGLNAEMELKPDIGAPGGLIRSTWPLEAGAYATISGTSMSSPHVAGAAALFLEAHPGASHADVRTALQNSADPKVWSGNPGLGLLEFVHRQGAGMVDIDDAILATATVTPSKVSLGEGTSANPKSVELTIANNGAAPVTYNLSHQAALATGGSTFAPGAFTTAAGVSFAPSSVTVPAGGSTTVNVTVTPPTSQGRVYGGYLVVTPAGGGQPLRVPYAGFSGDYQLIQVLAAGGCAMSPFPGIFKRGGETVCTTPAPPAAPTRLDIAVTRQPEGTTFNVEDSTDRPVILYHRAHQSRRLEIRAVDAATNQSYLVAFSDYVSRNAANGISFAAGGFSTYTWDGKRIFTNAAGKLHRQELPDGVYQLQIVVTKALAEANNPAHIETWTSPTIVITRN